MEWKTKLFRVTAWRGIVGRSFPERVDLVKAKTATAAMKMQRHRDSNIKKEQQSAGRIRRGCERWPLGK